MPGAKGWTRTVKEKRRKLWRDISREERTGLGHGLDRENEGAGNRDIRVSSLLTRKAIKSQ